MDPYGEIIATPLRGAWMGNRGCIHRGHEIVRGWATKRWIICALEFKGWTAPKWVPGRWTALFFYDEALALAAGHRPCALCRREAYEKYRAAVQMDGADAIDARLHAERLERRHKRTHIMAWPEIPIGAFVEFEGSPHIALADRVRPWSSRNGYGADRARPHRGDARVLTPQRSILAIQQGYKPHIHMH